MRKNNSITFDNIFIKDTFTIASKKESEGPIFSYFDEIIEDNYNNEESFEMAEVELLKKCINKLINKNKKIDLIISGDLNESNMSSNYANINNDIPFIGIYGACSTIIEAIIIGSCFIQSKNFDNIICATSSHNSNTEKLFRYPIEYGLPKNKNQTYTATGAAGCIISNETSSIKVCCATIGKVLDVDLKDPNDFGRIMVSSAIETYINHMENLNLSDNYYDLVITGDLSKVGSGLFIKGINELGHNIKNYNDCGLIIYDRDIQDVNMGGSGCATIALVMFGYIIKLMKENQYKKVLIIGTGALINKVLTLQNKGIPSISYAIGIEI